MTGAGRQESFGGFYNGKRVLVTGHTGFKGSWLALWLYNLGAVVHGYALDPPTLPNLFEAACIRKALARDIRADLSDLAGLRAAIESVRPDIVFHLAAQPLVMASYSDPVGTWATNVMGTAHVLDAVRGVESVGAVVVITTDKVYENCEGAHPYNENDRLGGHDPYSASKAAAEIVSASYRASFFSNESETPARIATVRAGNVIGGGDWAANRLIPDCVRAFIQGEEVLIRSPRAIRPWQHVLEPLAGYLQLARHLVAPGGDQLTKAWNFGPEASGEATVGEVADRVARFWGDGARVDQSPMPLGGHETQVLRLDSTLARTELKWKPVWSLDHALEQTVAWYRAWNRGEDMAAFSLDQISAYEAAAWA